MARSIFINPLLPNFHSPRETLHRWLAAIGCFAVLIFFFSPPWATFLAYGKVPEMGFLLEVRRGANVWYQVQHLGAPVPDSLHAAIQWRILFPLVGWILHLPPIALFALSHIGCVLVFWLVAGVMRQHGGSWENTVLSLFVVGASGWFFASVGWLGYYDSWIVFALLIISFGRSGWPLWAACLLAPWIDERFVMGLPLAYFCRWSFSSDSDAPAFWTRAKRDLLISSALIGIFILVRFGLLSAQSAPGATVAGYFANRNFVDAPFARICLGLWEGARAGWVFIGVAIFLQKSSAQKAIFGLAVLMFVGIGLFTAQDYGRSMMLLAPVVLYGILVAQRAWPKWLGNLLRLSALATLLLPAHQVMSDRVDSIYYLYHELAALHNPPPSIMPELYELQAIHAMERGEFAQADAELTLAIKLSDNPASPSRQRGILNASQHRWAEARRDFSIFVEHDSQNPEAWFLRAQADLATSDETAALADFKHATEIAPAGWLERTDVARFKSRLELSGRKP